MSDELPGKIVQVFNFGPAPAALTESGHVFVLNRAGGQPDGELLWECIPGPTAEDMKRTIK